MSATADMAATLLPKARLAGQMSIGVVGAGIGGLVRSRSSWKSLASRLERPSAPMSPRHALFDEAPPRRTSSLEGSASGWMALGGQQGVWEHAEGSDGAVGHQAAALIFCDALQMPLETARWHVVMVLAGIWRKSHGNAPRCVRQATGCDPVGEGTTLEVGRLWPTCSPRSTFAIRNIPSSVELPD